jgi:hypothetical protein
MVTLLNNIKDLLKEHYDVFITSASYEERSLSVLTSIGNKVSFGQKIVSLSVPHKELIKENLFVFEQMGFTITNVNNTNQIETVNNLIRNINGVLYKNPKASFLIDITTFTRQTLLILFRLLRNSLTQVNEIQFIYTPAKEYSVGLPYEDKWLTRGILEVNSVFGYSGIIRPSRPYHLIILMGFEVERASSLITAYEPTKITVGYASKDDSISEDHYQYNKLKFDELLSEFPYAESFEFSCVNVLNSKLEVLKQAKKHHGYNVIVSPMNNKISSLSCALAAFDNNEIQIAIAIPAIYNYKNYSLPGDTCYLLDMPDFIKTTVI